MKFSLKLTFLALFAFALACSVVRSSPNKVEADVPAPNEAEPIAAAGTQTAYFAGGCFWGVEAVFEHVKGVIDVRSGYSGGTKAAPSYEDVSEGDTGHAESVKVTFDPAKVTYTQLLTVFFSVAHDPTQLNRQGPDTGTQYRSAIFYTDDAQRDTALAFIRSLDEAKVFSKPVVTEVKPFTKFYEAEAYHQNYLRDHPNEPYIVINDKPKVEDLKKRFPDLYK